MQLDFPSREAMAAQAAFDLAQALESAIAARGRAGFAAAGGETPKLTYAHLARAPLDWGAISITLSDERWVPPEHALSNERVLRETLLKAAPGARFAPLYSHARDVEAGAAAADLALQSLNWPLDAIVLGMGEDGHIASLFPHARGLAGALTGQSLCAAIHPFPPPENAPVARLSFTAHAILSAREIFVLTTGRAKRETLLAAAAPGPVADRPVRLLLNQNRTPVRFYWAP